MQDLVSWILKAKSKKIKKKLFVSIASSLTMLKIETDACIKNIVFATTFFYFCRWQKAT